MNRKRKWLVDFSRRASNPHASPRRIVAPERLESRNAPGVMLPLMGSAFADNLNSDGEPDRFATQEHQIREYYRTEATAPYIPGHRTQIPLVEEFQADDTEISVVPSLASSRPKIPMEAAALDAAFESLAGELQSSLNELPPRLIQPVIMDPASPHNQEDVPSIPVAEATLPVVSVGSEPVAVPTATGSVQADISAPMPALEAVVAPVVLPVSPAGLGPRIIQPVIMDPESEHNAPNSTESTPAEPLAATQQHPIS